MGPKYYTIFGAFKKNVGLQKYECKIGYEVNIYLEWEKKSHKITDLKKLTNNTDIAK
jgi:hypothetical protein